MENVAKKKSKWWLWAIFIFMIAWFMGWLPGNGEIAEQKTEPRVQSSINTQAISDALTDHLESYLQTNFTGTTWFSLIERVDVNVGDDGNFSITAETNIYPDGDAARIAPRISTALMVWVTALERERDVELNFINIYGKRGESRVLLRSWDTIWGWQD